MDSLRYWVIEMHVDGFRFDLASTLAREFYDVDRLSAFFDLVQQDPVVSQVKLIAEPWDVGEGGYQVGNFPPLWTEWNGKYRDTVRDFWRGEAASLPEFASRLTGSSDLYEFSGRRPIASINFVTAHDGFTLHDLVSYNEKHNEANGEDSNDGESHNRSWNCGVEGPTDDLDIIALREQQKRNFLTTLLLSQGVPMILHGDEMGRTQHGNNNVYCQDNELSWVDWELAKENWALVEFTAKVAKLRRDHPVFQRRRFFSGTSLRGSGGVADIVWFTPDGTEMTDEDWDSGFGQVAGGVPQRRGDPQPRLPRRAGRRRLVPAAVQRPPRAGRVHRAAGRSTARAGWSRSTPRRRSRTTSGRSSPVATLVRRRPVAGGAAEAVLDVGAGGLPLATYRLAGQPDLHPRRRRARRRLPGGARGQPRLPARRCCRPAPGSMHGYDVVDHDRISAEAGGAAALGRLSAALRAARHGRGPRRRAQPHGRAGAGVPQRRCGRSCATVTTSAVRAGSTSTGRPTTCR